MHLRAYNDDFDAHRFLQRHLKVPKSLFAIDFVLSDIGSESADEKKYHLNIPDNNQATAKREDGLWQRRHNV